VITPGQIVLFRFPQTDLEQGKLRPALVIARLPGEFDDWLICMISTQTRHYLSGFDELIEEEDNDLLQSGLKTVSVIRI
jgi:mRNA interferase MazF